MEAKAQARFLRVSARKARLVADLIRGKRVEEAISILRHTPKGSSPLIEKIIHSAIANAEHNFDMDPNDLYIKAIYVDEGPTMKRIRPRAQGRASRINKRVK